MKKILFVLVIVLSTINSGYSQDEGKPEQVSRKGDLYFFWGWNRGWFSDSDITFKGSDYDFTLDKVRAFDRQSDFGYDPYFKLGQMTIPQYNVRIGYFIHHNYSISVGTDHMKYVMRQDQTVKISGRIDNSGTEYDGVYNNDNIILTEDFLTFEHTDGLNYVNADFRRHDEIFSWNKVKINLNEGIGVGVLFPKTNTKLLDKERYDEFHVSGYGISGVVAVNVNFFKYFFVQSELKGGYINMPNVRTTMSSADSASQSFFFSQLNIVFGAVINLKGNKKNN